MAGKVMAKVSAVEANLNERDVPGNLSGHASPAGSSSVPQPVLGSTVGGASSGALGYINIKMEVDKEGEEKYIENIVMKNFNSTITRESKVFVDGSEKWIDMRTGAHHMGFMIEEKTDHWEFLGVSKMESAEPDRNFIRGRHSELKDYLEKFSDDQLDPDEVTKRAQLVTFLEIAKDTVLKELPGVIKERKKIKPVKDKLPRWAETDKQFKIALALDFEKDTIDGTGLSNILQTKKEDGNGLIYLDIEEARRVTMGLWKGGSEAIEIIVEFAGKEVIIWAPQNREDLGRVASTISKALGEGIVSTITLVVPLDPKPQCHQVTQYTDLWTHELLQPKWSPFRRRVSFSQEPVRVVVSGSYAPMHQLKSLCLITLSTEGGNDTMGMLTSRGAIGKMDNKEIMLVDINADDEVDFLKATKDMKHIIHEWHGPSRSAGTTKEAKRLVFAGVIKEKGSWAARVAVMQVKGLLEHTDSVIGLHSTYGNPDSIIIEISANGVGTLVQDLTEDIVYISPKVLLARSTASEAQWKTKVEGLWDREGDYVEKVKYGPSQGGGAPWRFRRSSRSRRTEGENQRTRMRRR